jgi:hypothetical protein
VTRFNICERDGGAWRRAAAIAERPETHELDARGSPILFPATRPLHSREEIRRFLVVRPAFHETRPCICQSCACKGFGVLTIDMFRKYVGPATHNEMKHWKMGDSSMDWPRSVLGRSLDIGAAIEK